MSQRRFAAPRYEEIAPEPDVHIRVRNSFSHKRHLSIEASGAAMIWYSSGTVRQDRGSLMAYVPVADKYWAWYAGFKHSGADLNLSEHREINLDEFEHLTGQRHSEKIIY